MGIRFCVLQLIKHNTKTVFRTYTVYVMIIYGIFVYVGAISLISSNLLVFEGQSHGWLQPCHISR